VKTLPQVHAGQPQKILVPGVVGQANWSNYHEGHEEHEGRKISAEIR
jgi:hypothetical protein